MRKLLFAIAVGLVGAGLLHIVIILTLPQFTGRDAYSRVMALEEDTGSFTPLTSVPGSTGLANDNPYLRTAVCGFSITDQPMRFLAAGALPFWSLAIFDADSNEVFSMNDQTAVEGRLDLVVAMPAQLVALRKAAPPGLSKSILVEMSSGDGYAVLRALAPAASFEQSARNFLDEASCEPLRP